MLFLRNEIRAEPLFYYPYEFDLDYGMPFHCKILEVDTDPRRVIGLVEKSI